MPQASSELRLRMKAMFGSEIDEGGPIRFLKRAGYALNRDFTWTPKPGVTTASEMTKDEADCMSFLVDEWDFGWLRTER